jgi:hypothetical protein
MESIVRNVQDIASDERRVYESLLGHELQTGQQVVIRVLNLDVEPAEAARRSAMERANRVARQGRANAAVQGVTEDEAGAMIDGAIQNVRRSKP